MPKVADYKGYNIFYDAQYKYFDVDIGDIKLEAPTQTELEAKIDRTLKDSGLFPVKVICCTGHLVKYGRITSYDPQSKRGWFVGEDGDREKPWGFSGYYLDTEANHAVCEQVKAKQAEINRIADEVDELERRLERPFTKWWEEQAPKPTKTTGG